MIPYSQCETNLTQPLQQWRTHADVSFSSLNSNLRKRNCPVWYSNVAPSSTYNWPLALPWLGGGEGMDVEHGGSKRKGEGM